MKSEYVKLTHPEKVYGEANLLNSEISILTVMQKYQEFKKLRKRELFLKVELKKLIEDAKESLDTVSRILPKTKFDEDDEIIEINKEIFGQIQISQKEIIKEEQAKYSIEEELEQIKKRLEKLQ
jgi:hypothetical protein